LIKLLKYLGIVFLTIVLIVLALMFSHIEYQDKTPSIKPTALKLLKNMQFIQDEEHKLLSKERVISLLKKSGCENLSDIESNIVKTTMTNTDNISNHWFSATCSTHENAPLDLRITLHEDALPDFSIYLEHSYCFSVMHKRVECYTQKIIPVPSR